MPETTDNDKTRQSRADVTMIMKDLAVPAAESQLGRASLVVLSGWEIGREVEVHGSEQILGRSANAGTQIDAASVSRQHAKIDIVRDGDEDFFTITDLGSSNGTQVNNIDITTARLRDGDRIRMGDVLFKFVVQDEIESSFHQQVHRLIHFDQLTGLLTMDAFRQRLEAHMRQSSRSKPFSLAMTDLDGLKRVNDTHGHLAGRMVVREMGTMMRQALRSQDLAGLYGGDEGILLFPATALADAAEVAENLRATVATRVFEHHGQSFGVTISQGIAEWPQHGDSMDSLIAAADKALYRAKAEGRNRVCLALDG